MVLLVLLIGPSRWGQGLATTPKTLTWRWHKPFAAQLTGLDLTWAGHIVALTVAPLQSGAEHRVHVFDSLGKELWSRGGNARMLGVSLSADGALLAVGMFDFSIALFANTGELLWQRKSVGLPLLSPQGDLLIAFNGGIAGPDNALLEVFRSDGEKVWSLRRKGRVWRAMVSDQNDLLLGLWNGEVLFIDRQRRLLWQRLFAKDVVTLTMSPDDAQYIAVGTGILDQAVYLVERTGRQRWRRHVPYGVTDISLAKQGAFLLSYSNTIYGQHLTLYGRDGEVRWTYQVREPAMEGSKAVIVPDEPLVVAGIERERQHYLQGFGMAGEVRWIAPLPAPIFDFRVSRDGRYVAAATDHALYFFDTREVDGPKAHLQD
jgi:outer membrane protein assembly factor BamB